VLGITGAKQQFSPLALAILSTTTEQMLYKVLSDFKTLIMTILGISFRPDYVMMDADFAERNACMQVFGLTEREVLMCFFHVQKNVKERIKGLAQDEQKEYLLIFKQLDIQRTKLILKPLGEQLNLRG
jgi:hypothetical protein